MITLENEDERRAWVAFAAGLANNHGVQHSVVGADTMLADYRKRVPRAVSLARVPTEAEWAAEAEAE